MNRWLAIACGFAAMITVVHIIGGGSTVHLPLLATQTSAELGAYVSVLWHGATAALALMTIAFGIATIAPRHRPALGWVGVFISAAFLMLFVGYGATRLATLWIMPQWTVFALICGLAIAGLGRSGQTTP